MEFCPGGFSRTEGKEVPDEEGEVCATQDSGKEGGASVLNLTGDGLRPSPAIFLLILLVTIASPPFSEGKILRYNTVWQGQIDLKEDILIPKGVTLTIRPGTTVRVFPSESTRTDPEYISSLTEITVRGRLRAGETGKARVRFVPECKGRNCWAGILVDTGRTDIHDTDISGAETAIMNIKGGITGTGLMISGNRIGVFSLSDTSLRDSIIKGNEIGIVAPTVESINLENTPVQDSEEGDFLRIPRMPEREGAPVVPPHRGKHGRYYTDSVIRMDTVWEGRVSIEGSLRVPPGVRLVVLPGTVVEFRWRDSNGDGIGESGLMVQGTLLVKGTPSEPVVFMASGGGRGRGLWDSINILNSDLGDNLIEYAIIQNAYRGLHFHYSNVILNRVTLRENYRAVQFQESRVEIIDSWIYHNQSGLRARDSQVLLLRNMVEHNLQGLNLYRVQLTARGNLIAGNPIYGIRIREGAPVFTGNIVAYNGRGLLVLNAMRGEYTGNIIVSNGQAGMYMKNSMNILISRNIIQANGLGGVLLQDTGAVVSENLISDNAGRGAGLYRFSGVVRGNNFYANRPYHVELEGGLDVDAPGNYFDRPVDSAVLDGRVEKTRGRLLTSGTRKEPVVIPVPPVPVITDLVLHGRVQITKTLEVLPDSTLRIEPGTRLEFSPGAGMKIRGRIESLGSEVRRVVITSSGKGEDGRWDEILLERARGGRFLNTDFRNARWAIHSHFTDLLVEGCRFTGNEGGIRLRSGPVRIRRSLFTANRIGIRVYLPDGVVEDNEITGNETGIFIREGGGGIRITRNNIYANEFYNLRVGDFNEEDVDARGNYWGEGDPLRMIFDGRREEGIGKVLLTPVADKPIDNPWHVGEEHKY
jgi:parallel beta-helix repeat protein